MTKKIAALLLAVTAGVGLSFAVQAPAQASYSSCNTGTACIWDGRDGAGSPIGGGFFASPGTCFDLFGAQDNSADSFRNHTTRSIQFYDGHGCTGDLLKSEDGRTIFDGVTQANFMQRDQVISHPGCQFQNTCFANRASSVFFNTAFAGPTLLTQTEDAMSDCTATGWVCVWENANFGGAWTRFNFTNSCHSVPSGWNDRISSLWNRFTSSGAKVTFYKDGGCTGSSNSYSPNSSYSWVGLVFNDSFSSYWIGPGAP